MDNDATSNDEIVAQINKRRDDLSISQIELASLLKISIEDLIAIETDILSKDVDILLDLCRILKCTADYLLCFSTNPKEVRKFTLVPAETI